LLGIGGGEVFEKVFHARCRPSLRITSSCAPPTTCRWPAVVEGQASALSIRYEERSKRIPLLIRLHQRYGSLSGPQMKSASRNNE
jgi:hypothetical protein